MDQPGHRVKKMSSSGGPRPGTMVTRLVTGARAGHTSWKHGFGPQAPNTQSWGLVGKRAPQVDPGRSENREGEGRKAGDPQALGLERCGWVGESAPAQTLGRPVWASINPDQWATGTGYISQVQWFRKFLAMTLKHKCRDTKRDDG